MLDWLAHWHNWPFLFTLLVGMGLVGVTLLGFSKDFDHGVDTDVDGDHHVHTSTFAFIGAGKAPLSVIIEVLLVSFGLVGLLVNAVARDLLGEWGVVAFPFSLVAAVVGSIMATRSTANIISKWAPADAPSSRRPGDFVRSVGTTVSLVTKTIGQVKVESSEKNAPDAIVNVYVDPTWADDIPRGVEVLLVEYDRTRNLYAVRPL